MSDDYHDDGDITPRIEMGVPNDPSLAVIEHYSGNKPFTYRDGIQDEYHVVEGEIPPYIMSHFYGFFAKDVVLSNMSEKEIQLSMLRFKRARVAFRMSTSRSDFTYETLRHLDNLENLYKAKLRRSIGGFERIRQQTQVTEQLVGHATNSGGGEPRKRSYLQTLFGGN